MDKQNGLIAAVIIFFLGLFLYTKIVGPIPFFVNSIQTAKTVSFRTEGTGKAAAPPDVAKISFGITKNAPTVLDAQNQVNSHINSIIKALKNLKIKEKDIKTTNYSVYPNYNYELGRQRINGYNVTQNIEITIREIGKVNDAVDSVTVNGGNIIGQLIFDFDNETRKKLEDQARKEAIKEAKEKAESLARISGIHLGKIINVEEISNRKPIPVFSDTVGRGGDSDEKGTEIIPGESKVELTVALSYEIR